MYVYVYIYIYMLDLHACQLVLPHQQDLRHRFVFRSGLFRPSTRWTKPKCCRRPRGFVPTSVTQGLFCGAHGFCVHMYICIYVLGSQWYFLGSYQGLGISEFRFCVGREGFEGGKFETRWVLQFQGICEGFLGFHSNCLLTLAGDHCSGLKCFSDQCDHSGTATECWDCTVFHSWINRGLKITPGLNLCV